MMIRKGRQIFGMLFASSSSTSQPRPHRDTAWLDGVRGMAAFLVMLHHFNMQWLSPFADAPFGAVSKTDRNPDGIWWYRQGEHLWEFWRLPFIRVLVVSGSAQVAVFFVLSGLVLSWGPLMLLRAERYEKFARSLGSSVVRRWFRLFLPCMAVSVLYLLDLIIKYRHGFGEIMAELWKFVYSTERWARPFNVGQQLPFATANPYGFIMWTIPFEFSGSIFVYLTLMAVGRIPKYSRRCMAMFVIVVYALVSVHWAYWLFGSGMMIADYMQEVGGFKKLSARKTKRSSYLWIALFIVGAYLMGTPPGMDWWDSPMYYRWLTYIPVPTVFKDFIGRGRLWWGIGGILTVASSCHFDTIRAFYELPVAQYLGKISFMLYLIHVLILDRVGMPLRFGMYQTFSKEEFSETFKSQIWATTPLLNLMIHLVDLVICILVSVVVAHFLEVYVDRPCTRVGKIVDDKLLNGFGDQIPVSHEEQQLLHTTRSMDVEMAERPQRLA